MLKYFKYCMINYNKLNLLYTNSLKNYKNIFKKCTNTYDFVEISLNLLIYFSCICKNSRYELIKKFIISFYNNL